MAGRLAAPISITNNILPGNILETFKCMPKTIYESMQDCMQWLKWLAERHLIRNTNDCANCQRPMCLVRRAESPDGYSWKCRSCNTRSSIRTGSFFCTLRSQHGKNCYDDVLLGTWRESKTCSAVSTLKTLLIETWWITITSFALNVTIG